METVALDLSRFEIAISLDAIDDKCASDDTSNNSLVKQLFKYCDLFPWQEELTLIERIESPIFIECNFIMDDFWLLNYFLCDYLQDDPQGIEKDLLSKMSTTAAACSSATLLLHQA